MKIEITSQTPEEPALAGSTASTTKRYQLIFVCLFVAKAAAVRAIRAARSAVSNQSSKCRGPPLLRASRFNLRSPWRPTTGLRGHQKTTGLMRAGTHASILLSTKCASLPCVRGVICRKLTQVPEMISIFTESALSPRSLPASSSSGGRMSSCKSAATVTSGAFTSPQEERECTVPV